MKMKRILATALAVMMAMSLAACGQKSEQSANSGSDTKSTTIHLWANGSDNVRQVFEALSADFNGNRSQSGLSGGIELPALRHWWSEHA